VDGEIVAFDQSGKPSFNTLQNHGSSGVLLLYFIFDVMILAGREVTKLPLEARQELLQAKVLPHGHLFMTLIHTCELNGCNPFDYLTELLPRCANLSVHPLRDAMELQRDGGTTHKAESGIVCWSGLLAEKVPRRPSQVVKCLQWASQKTKARDLYGQLLGHPKMFRAGLYSGGIPAMAINKGAPEQLDHSDRLPANIASGPQFHKERFFAVAPDKIQGVVHIDLCQLIFRSVGNPPVTQAFTRF
jgi:hypothetical protein